MNSTLFAEVYASFTTDEIKDVTRTQTTMTEWIKTLPNVGQHLFALAAGVSTFSTSAWWSDYRSRLSSEGMAECQGQTDEAAEGAAEAERLRGERTEPDSENPDVDDLAGDVAPAPNDAQIAARLADLQCAWEDVQQTVLIGSEHTRDHVDDLCQLLDEMGADACVLRVPGFTYTFQRSQYGKHALNVISQADGAADEDDVDMGADDGWFAGDDPDNALLADDDETINAAGVVTHSQG